MKFILLFTLLFFLACVDNDTRTDPADETPPTDVEEVDNSRPNVIVSSDIGGSDPDDYQSMIHFFMYLDKVKVQGLISSPPNVGRVQHIHEVINAYEKDYSKLAAQSDDFPQADHLRSVSAQGATVASPAAGYGNPTAGSQLIVRQLQALSPEPVYVIVWGSITDVAQAVHDAPDIKSNLRIYSIGSWNTSMDKNARNYLYNNHGDLWWIESDYTFRGMYNGGDQSGEWSNEAFPRLNVNGHGNLGNLFYAKMREIKMGDSPSALYVLNGDVNDPETDSWGGKFIKTGHGENYWHDHNDPQYQYENYPGANTVNQWRTEFLGDWKKRMDWLQ